MLNSGGYGPRSIEVIVDLADLDFFEFCDVTAVFDTLRREQPVYWNASAETGGFWALTRYDDVAWAWKQPKLFSSEWGNMLRLHGRKDPAAGKMMVVTDPPRHTRLRALLNQGFQPRVVEHTKLAVQLYVSDLLDLVAAKGEVDFAVEVAAKLPLCVTCDMIGIPQTDWALVADLSTSSLAGEDPEYRRPSASESALQSVNTELLFYFLDLIAQRRREPADDLVSALVDLRLDGGRLSDEEIALNCFSFLLGGNETTRHAATGGLLVLMERPEEMNLLATNEACLSTAVEEVLRWTTPAMHVLRVALQDVDVGDHRIRAGQTVTLWSISANRDEAVFTEPDRFDLYRTPNRHLTFGIGNHYCIGAHIARLELRQLFRELALRQFRFHLIENPVRLRSNFLSGFKHLKLRLVDSR